MKFLKKASGFVIGLLCVLTFAAGQETTQQSSDGTSLSLVRVGPVDISNGEHAVLQQANADLFGRAWNYRDKEFYALLRLREGQQWYVAAAGKPEPGGVFNIGGVRFPQAGDFELLVTLREPNSLTVGNWIDESQWRDRSFAVSQRVSITVENPPVVDGDTGDKDSHIALVSIGNVSLRAGEINSVPAAGDVLIRSRGLPDSKFFLVLHVPYTDLCYVIGPAQKGSLPNTHVFHSVSFDAPGDPQQVHFDLLAFTSSKQVRPGPTSWQSFRLSEAVTSLSTQVLIEGRQPSVESLRVPFVAITRIGRHVLDRKQPERQLDLEQGDRLEIESYERTTEGAKFWGLTRVKGSTVWFAQGPMLPRGVASSVAEDGRTVVARVLPSLHFQTESETALEEAEFEVMAILSNSIFPNSWISSASISAQTIETISQPVAVRVKGPASLSHHRLSITHIGSQEVDEGEMTVGVSESVIIDRPNIFSGPLKIYVGKHVVGTSTWSFFEAIPNGKTHFVPALHFTNPHAEPGTRYQVLAIATNGPLPAREAEYQDFLPHVVMASELITVRYSNASVLSFVASIKSLFLGEAESDPPLFSPEVIAKMFWIFLLIILALLLIFALLILLLRSNPALAGEIADTLQQGYATGKKRFEAPGKISLANFLLGLALLGVMLYIIKYFYISLYTSIITAATTLPPKASNELALYLILITAFAGIFADVAYKQAHRKRAPEEEQSDANIYRYIFAGSRSIAIVLWILQGAIYSLFFKSSTGSFVMGGVGFGVGVLLSAVETIAFFLITEVTLVPAAYLILAAVLAPVYILSLIFRFVQRVFERKPPEPPETKAPPELERKRPEPPETKASSELASQPETTTAVIIEPAPAHVEAK